MTGYFKKILRVDLSERRIRTSDLDDSIIEKYMGGSGIASRYFVQETTPDAEPLAPDTPLLAFAGPFTGTSIPAASPPYSDIHSRDRNTSIFLTGTS